MSGDILFNRLNIKCQTKQNSFSLTTIAGSCINIKAESRISSSYEPFSGLYTGTFNTDN